MNKESRRTPIWFLMLLSLALLGLVSLACRKEPREQSGAQKPPAGGSRTAPASARDRTATGADQTAQTGKEPQVRLADVIAAARSWYPVFEAFARKPAPDFTVKDIMGQEHKLSSYRGRQALVVIWAPWCGACKMEIPDLVELRKAIPQNQLAILALSPVTPDNTEEMVRLFVQQIGTINYAVAAVGTDGLPAPFSAFQYLPTSFFIGPDGTFKLATVGVVPLADMRAILRARSEAPQGRTPTAPRSGGS